MKVKLIKAKPTDQTELIERAWLPGSPGLANYTDHDATIEVTTCIYQQY